MPHESPQGQHLNVMAVLAAPDTKTADPPPPLTWWVRDRSWKGEDLVAFLQQALPPDRGVPRLVVMDNASIHRGNKVREALPALRAQNLDLEYLPTYRPELNDIEQLFRKAKHEAMPQRLQPNQRALTAAVHACFQNLQDELASSYLSMRNA